MVRRKPFGFPPLMTGKRLKAGKTAYYWSPPTRARQAGCPVQAEALGSDYGSAKQRCDQVLNPQYLAWLKEGDFDPSVALMRGTFDWMVSIYKQSRQYKKLPTETQSSYDRMLALVSKVPLRDQRTFGILALQGISPAAADNLFEKLKINPKGVERTRTAVLAMSVCRRAWKVAYRAEHQLVPEKNPFQGMGLSYRSKPTKLFRHPDLLKFVETADAMGEASLGTAAMIAFYWLQREVDILSRLVWTRYRPVEHPNDVMIVHPKTGVLFNLPLYDDEGELWPELMQRLDHVDRTGPLIVMRDKPDRFKRIFLPWKKRHFLRRVAVVRAAAGISPEIKFMGLRHGGNTEGADANLTDAQLRALSGHKSTAMLLYAQSTVEQQKLGARKRLNARTKRGNLSE